MSASAVFGEVQAHLMAPIPAAVMTPDPRATIQNLLACRWLARDISTALDGKGIQTHNGWSAPIRSGVYMSVTISGAH